MSDDVIRVLLVEDHELFRTGLVAVLGAADDIAVVGQAATGEEGVALARRLAPHVVLMDLALPGIDGVEATRQIVRETPGVGVVALTMFDEDAAVLSALRAGARGYVLKDAERGALLRAVRAVHQGEALLSANVARQVLDRLDAPETAGGRVAGEGFERLTLRERDVLDLIAEGLRNVQIAHRLRITEKTVENHTSSILAKLHVSDRAQAIVRAYREGYVR